MRAGPPPPRSSFFLCRQCSSLLGSHVLNRRIGCETPESDTAYVQTQEVDHEARYCEFQERADARTQRVVHASLKLVAYALSTWTEGSRTRSGDCRLARCIQSWTHRHMIELTPASHSHSTTCAANPVRLDP